MGKMKKIFILFLAVAMLFSFAACTAASKEATTYTDTGSNTRTYPYRVSAQYLIVSPNEKAIN
jgi:acid phosphatase class B